MTEKRRIALITGITGQDGSYLAELLLSNGYDVHGVVRRASSLNTGRIDHLYRDPHEPGPRMTLHHGDVTDAGAMAAIVRKVRPTEVYNLAAQSHVRVSFDQPIYTANATAIGAANLLEAIRQHTSESGDAIRFYQASSSEMFGGMGSTPQNELTPFHPRSPYACAKLFAHTLTINYREAYGLHASCGILFNHESPRRGETFVTRKITAAACRIKLGLQEKLYLGNLEAARDWGHAADYVRAMWLMLQMPNARDYVIATGTTRTVREFARTAFGLLDMDYEDHVEFDPRYQRPAEVNLLLGDASKAKWDLGWTPTRTFDQLVAEMIDHDMEQAQRELSLRRAGHKVEVSQCLN